MAFMCLLLLCFVHRSTALSKVVDTSSFGPEHLAPEVQLLEVRSQSHRIEPTWAAQLDEVTEASPVSVRVGAPGASVDISLEHQGRQLCYRVVSVALYAANASAGRSGAKRWRAAEEGVSNCSSGRASLLLEGDRATGLLEVPGVSVLRISPASGSAASSLHRVEIFAATDVVEDLSLLAVLNATTRPELITDDGSDFEAAYAKAGNVNGGGRIDRLRVWNGRPWWPGCYPADSRMHRLAIGVALDHTSIAKYGREGARRRAEEIVSEASFVYEMQLHMRLEIGELLFLEGQDAPEWSQCSYGNAQGHQYESKIERLAAWRGSKGRKVASWHLLTLCRNEQDNFAGMVGLAYVGEMCHSSYSVSISRVDFPGAWKIFAHELGHILGAEHSFEKGKGRTGGLMDYGDGRLNGVYQFNTQYRKKEMCRNIAQKYGRCRTQLTKDPAAACAQLNDSNWRDGAGVEWTLRQNLCGLRAERDGAPALQGSIKGSDVQLADMGKGSLNDWSNMIAFESAWTRVVTCSCEALGRPSPANTFACNVPSISGYCDEFKGCVMPGNWSYPGKGRDDPAWAKICAPVPSKAGCVLLPRTVAGRCDAINGTFKTRSLRECKQRCYASTDCNGIEFDDSSGTCGQVGKGCDFGAYNQWGDARVESRACFAGAHALEEKAPNGRSWWTWVVVAVAAVAVGIAVFVWWNCFFLASQSPLAEEFPVAAEADDGIPAL